MSNLIKNNEIIIKKSKFYGFLYNVENIDEINLILNNLKIEHKKATHICYAYKTGVSAKYFDDDGNTSGFKNASVVPFVSPAASAYN